MKKQRLLIAVGTAGMAMAFTALAPFAALAVDQGDSFGNSSVQANLPTDQGESFGNSSVEANSQNLNSEAASQSSGASPRSREYTALEPLPGSGRNTYSDLGDYLNFLFPILITIGALIGVTTFTVFGVVYMTSSVVGDKKNAVGRMQKSILGLLLLISSVLILETINPNLVNFDLNLDEYVHSFTPNSTGSGTNVQGVAPGAASRQE